MRQTTVYLIIIIGSIFRTCIHNMFCKTDGENEEKIVSQKEHVHESVYGDCICCITIGFIDEVMV